jgi:hypothetical protein
MRSADLSRVIDAFGPSEVQKQRMLDGIAGRATARRRKGRFAKVLAVAAVIALCSGTVTAFSNTELFRGIFGNSIYLVEDKILFPMAGTSDEQFRLTLEGVLSDAYGSTAVVSVEALNEAGRRELDQVASRLQIAPLQQAIRANRSTVTELHHLSDKSKKRFLVGFAGLDGPLSGDLEVSLTTAQSRLALTVPTVSTIPDVTVRIDEGRYAAADYVPVSVSITPLSVTVSGYERTVVHDIPHPHVILRFADGTALDVFSQESGFSGARFPEERTVTVSAQFERMIDLHKLRSVTVDGVAYAVGE